MLYRKLSIPRPRVRFVRTRREIKNDGPDDGDTIRWQFDRLGRDASVSVTYNALLKRDFQPGKSSVESGKGEPRKWCLCRRTHLPSILIGLLAIISLAVLAYVGAVAKYSADDRDSTRALSGF